MAFIIAVQVTDLVVEEHYWPDEYAISTWQGGTTFDVKLDGDVVRDYPRENIAYIDRNPHGDGPRVSQRNVGEMQ